MARTRKLARGRPRQTGRGDRQALGGLRAAREAAGISQRELAARIRVPRSTLDGWERGLRVDAASAKRLAEALGCEERRLVG